MRYFLLVALFVITLQAAMTPKQLTQKTCSQCHSMAIVYEQEGNAEFWSEVIDAMYKNGLTPLRTEERLSIMNYLFERTYKNKSHHAFRRRPLK